MFGFQIPTVFIVLVLFDLAAAHPQQDLDNNLRPREEEPALASFGQTINVLGQMERTDQDFVDGLTLDLFSPKNRTVVVEQNFAPLPGHFVRESSGEPFIALSNYSWIIKMNETANDLIAKVELPYHPDELQRMGVDIANTYVGVLDADRKAWVVLEGQRNVHISENKTRIIKMTSLSGEYQLLGRKTEDNSNIFVQYGQGATRTVNITGGVGVQEAEFIDGLRFSVESEQAFTMNADIKNGVDASKLPEGTSSLNSYSWVVNSSIPGQNVRNADLRIPFNTAILAAQSTNISQSLTSLRVAKRSVGKSDSEMFSPLSESQTILSAESRIKISGLSQVDGEYILLLRR